MLISITLIDRTIPGFKDLIDTVNRTYKAQITTSLIDFPLTRSFRSGRKQFDAELLLKELRPYGSNANVRLFIFREDIFANGLNFVFGLAATDSCIVSTVRLDPRFYGEIDMKKAAALFRERMAKETLYRIGQCLGLNHCGNHCVMALSETIEEIDAKSKHFCAKCSKELELKIQSRNEY